MAPKKAYNQPKLSAFFVKASTLQNTETTPKADKRQIETDSKSASSSPQFIPKKRKRIIESSDEENDGEIKASIEQVASNNRMPLTPRSQACGSALNTPKTSSRSQMSSSFISSFRYDETDAIDDEINFSCETTPRKPRKEQINDDVDTQMIHLTFEWLKPAKIKDIHGRIASHSDYDPRTLFVPAEFLNKQTPAHQQWWQFKSHYYDTVLFFKVGKFYEMFHMDAVVGVEHLKLAYMRGNYAHCGFPESAYGNFAEQLVRKGFKVARIEQTETPSQLADRNTQMRTNDKVVKREICRITSQATQTYSAFEAAAINDQEVNTGPSDSNFLMSICEKKSADNPTKTHFGIAFVECAAGRFYFCQFIDDERLSSLRTILSHNQPTQILKPRQGISKLTQAVIDSILGPVAKEELLKHEFLTADETLKLLLDDDYLGAVSSWPETLSNLVQEVEQPIPKPKSDYKLALSALGAIFWYLRKCLIDVDLITMRKFERYIPATMFNIQDFSETTYWTNRRMVLDGNALQSLHLLPEKDYLTKSRANFGKLGRENTKFSLLDTINFCATSFGSRLLRQWICAPTCDQIVLKPRQEAIQFLCTTEAKRLVEFATSAFKKVSDLERLFQRLHVSGLKYRTEKHPDGRAQFFEAARYNSRKVRDLCEALKGLEQIQQLISFFKKEYSEVGNECPSLLIDCLGNEFTDMQSDLDFFRKLIPDREKTVKEGQIKPKKGMDPEYDKALADIATTEERLEQYLYKQQRKLNSKNISYTGSGNNRYQLEIPEEFTADLGNNYELKSKRKGFKRYRTPELEALIQELGNDEKKRDSLLDDSSRRVFEDFDRRKEKWARVVHKMATFDCLLSLSIYVSKSSLTMCVPIFDFESKEPYLEIRNGYHPSLASGNGVLASSEYIPNDTILGGKTAPVLLLTGANMGGKSTLMRQVANLTVLAQIGSLVPAKSMRLTPIDRIFSRIGASDCLAAGQSTFYTELDETNVILKESSRHSLMIIDELGRGTSTFDGTAIATAVLRRLVYNIRCRTLFSTHYHSLCREFANKAEISLGHMACFVENDDPNGDPSMENVTFLYTLRDGPSPKSYGFFTARMAGLNLKIVRRAYQYGKMMEEDNNKQNLFLKLCDIVKKLKENNITDEELVNAVKL